MKEQFEKEDELVDLLRKQGLLKPSADFTSRVMQRIEQAHEHETVTYQPLLSTKAWALIIGGFLLTVLLCWYFFSGSPSDSAYSISGSLERVRNYVNNLDLSFQFNSSALLIITLAILSMGVLIMLDLWISNNRRQDSFKEA